jgi:hypothetical protein
MVGDRDLERVAPTVAGVTVGLTGLGLIGMGLWGRREVRTALERERVVSTPDANPPRALVVSAGGARSMAEVIRRITVEATGGRTYAEVEPYLDVDGNPVSDEAQAMKDERTGRPIANPDADLWIQSTTLQTALMQAYMAFRLSELMLGLGGAFVAAGIGLVAAGRTHSSRRWALRGRA